MTDREVLQEALDAASAGSVVSTTGKAVWSLDGPIRVPAGVTLAGASFDRDGVLGSLVTTPDFDGSAVIELATQSQSAGLRDLSIDASALPESSVVAGVQATGYVHGVHMQNVTVRGVTGHSVELVKDLAGGKVPYSWHMTNVNLIGRNAGVGRNGFHLIGTDHVLIGCRTLGIRGHGYYLYGNPNSKLIGCNAEFSMWNGFYVTGSLGIWQGSGGVQLSACSTDRNRRNGILVDATGNAPVVISGCSLRRDGANGWPGQGGGGYAGLRVQNAQAPVLAEAVTCYPGVNDDGTGVNSPQYGACVSGSTWVGLSSGFYHGASKGIHDGGGNFALVGGPVLGQRTGSTSTPGLPLPR